MELLLIRHAKAEAHGHSGGDGARALVEKGHAQSKKVGEFLKKRDLVPEIVLTSPVLRAKETAEIICDQVGLEAPVTEAWLSCGMGGEEALHELSAYSSVERLAIVGHEPDFSHLIGSLLGVELGYVEVKKASVILLTCYPPKRGGVLHFNIPPKLL